MQGKIAMYKNNKLKTCAEVKFGIEFTKIYVLLKKYIVVLIVPGVMGILILVHIIQVGDETH